MSGTKANGEHRPSDRQAGLRQRVLRLVDPQLRVLFALAGMTVALSYAGRLHWVFDNLSSFVVLYAVAGLLFLIWFLAIGRRRWAIAAAVMLGASLVRLWPGAAEPLPPELGEPLRIVSANVKTTNRQYDRFTAFVREVSPDLLLVIETDAGWIDALEPLRAEYPHSLVEPRNDNFGIAFFSRLPFDEATIIDPGKNQVPTIMVRFTREGVPLTVIGTHTLPPARKALAVERDRHLEELAAFVRTLPGEVILTGDLNLSPWSPHFDNLLRESKLRDSRAGFGIQPTWPAGFPPLLTPIDHLLVSEGVTLLDRRVGPNVGSDHHPVIATVALRRSDAAP